MLTTIILKALTRSAKSALCQQFPLVLGHSAMASYRNAYSSLLLVIAGLLYVSIGSVADRASGRARNQPKSFGPADVASSNLAAIISSFSELICVNHHDFPDEGSILLHDLVFAQDFGNSKKLCQPETEMVSFVYESSQIQSPCGVKLFTCGSLYPVRLSTPVCP